MQTFVPTVEFVNSVLNAPGVRPVTVPAHMLHLDCRQFLDKASNAALAYPHGVMLAEDLGRGLYEGHMFCLPDHRGAEALEFGHLALKWLFDTVGINKLTVAAPFLLPQVRFYCRRLGLTAVGRDLFHEYFEAETAV